MEKVKELLNNILKEYISENYIFRGTSKVYSRESDGIRSSLYHWAKTEGVFFYQFFKPIHMEEEILGKAKKHFSPNTTNIEMLTDLRHYGARVNLIDFSRSLYTALFFACNGDFDKDGELILFNINRYSMMEDIKYNQFMNIASTIGMINPVDTNITHRRIIAQNSIFLYASEGYIEKKNIIKLQLTKV